MLSRCAVRKKCAMGCESGVRFHLPLRHCAAHKTVESGYQSRSRRRRCTVPPTRFMTIACALMSRSNARGERRNDSLIPSRLLAILSGRVGSKGDSRPVLRFVRSEEFLIRGSGPFGATPSRAAEVLGAAWQKMSSGGCGMYTDVLPLTSIRIRSRELQRGRIIGRKR